jgi:hypothetical protein
LPTFISHAKDHPNEVVAETSSVKQDLKSLLASENNPDIEQNTIETLENQNFISFQAEASTPVQDVKTELAIENENRNTNPNVSISVPSREDSDNEIENPSQSSQAVHVEAIASDAEEAIATSQAAACPRRTQRMRTSTLQRLSGGIQTKNISYRMWKKQFTNFQPFLFFMFLCIKIMLLFSILTSLQFCFPDICI